MKQIKIAVTVDERGGLGFGGRRQSRDRILIEDLCSSVNTNIYVSEMTASLFKGHEDKVKVVKNPLSECCDGETAFLELTEIGGYLKNIREIIVYNWNRHYPSDIKLDIDPEKNGYILNEEYDFTGSSHDKITKKIYKKN